MSKHLRQEDVARFITACTATDLDACAPLEAHLQACPRCRVRVAEFRVLEARLHAAFVSPTWQVSDAEVHRAAAQWADAGMPVLLPLPGTPPPRSPGDRERPPLSFRPRPHSSDAEADDPHAPPRVRERWHAGHVRAFARPRTFLPMPMRLPMPRQIAAVAACVALMLFGVPRRAVSNRAPAAPAGVVATPPLISHGNAQFPAIGPWSTGAAAMHRATVGMMDVPTDRRALRTQPRAVRRAPPPTSRVQSPARTAGRPLPLAHYEFVTAVSAALAPPLRASFLTCALESTSPAEGCLDIIARAQAVVSRGHDHDLWPGANGTATPEPELSFEAVWDDVHRRAASDAPRR